MRRTVVVVTRVAQSIDLISGEISNRPPLPSVPSAEWLESRVAQLERVTAASLARVTIPLIWVWRVHADRQEQARAIARRVYPEAVIVDRESTCAAMPRARSFVVIRLDSDDALMPARVDELAGMRLQPGTLVNWRAGWKLNYETGQMLAWEWPRRRQGPFFAVTRDCRDGMLDVPLIHERARDGCREIIHVDERSWIWTYHGGNAMNRWRLKNAPPPLSDAEAREVCERMGVTG